MKNIAYIILFISTTALAQDIDLNMLIEETQLQPKLSNPDDFALFWWIPNEFWIGSFQQDPSIDQATLDEFINIVSPYTMFVAVHGKMNVLGTFSFESKDAIMKKSAYDRAYHGVTTEFKCKSASKSATAKYKCNDGTWVIDGGGKPLKCKETGDCNGSPNLGKYTYGNGLGEEKSGKEGETLKFGCAYGLHIQSWSKTKSKVPFICKNGEWVPPSGQEFKKENGLACGKYG
mgnify:CR=1 FL=1